MDVTQKNFYNLLPEIIYQIKTCDFCAIDCELSGIIPFEDLDKNDTVAKRYERMRESDENYVILQIGLAFFKRLGDDLVQSMPYNFYISSTTAENYVDFLCLNKAIKFLADNHFDFNKCFTEGIHYVKKTDVVSIDDSGFSQIIWLLSDSNKLIVGHNMAVDLMQIVKQFFFSPLPNTYNDFKLKLSEIFKNIIDIKYMASVYPLNSVIERSALQLMHETLSNDVRFKQVKLTKDFFHNIEMFHNAGYDAYITGLCYIRMADYLCNSIIMKKYMNKVFLMRVYDKQAYFNFQSEHDYDQDTGEYCEEYCNCLRIV